MYSIKRYIAPVVERRVKKAGNTTDEVTACG